MKNEHVVLRALYEQNPWWVGGNVPIELIKPIKNLRSPFKRRDFFVLRKELEKKEITAIIGPRQVGKSTVLWQLVDFLVNEKKVDPKRVLYFSFDYPRLKTEISINDVLDAYTTSVLHEAPRELRAPIYIFLDEVCRVKEWSKLLKGWYDLKYPIKFVASHSSSFEVLKGASESLVGRITPYIMLPLKFVDVVRFHYGKEGESINHLSIQMRNDLTQAIKRGNLKEFFNSLKEVRSGLTPYEDSLKALLQVYLLKDGYPGLLDESSLRVCAQKLENYLSLTLYKDVVQIFGVRDSAALEELLVLLADFSSSLVEYSTLSKTLSIKLDTVKNYLNYLQAVFLISRTEFYSKSRAARIKKRDKVYVTNVGLRNVLLGQLDESLLSDTQSLGKVVETLVYEHCLRLCFYLAGPLAKLFYWRSPKGTEIDIVMEVSRKPIPIEVTYSTGDKKELQINEFIKKHKSPFGIVVTKDTFDLRNEIIYIPLWLFLIIC